MLENTKVLIVDDEPLTGKTMATSLKEQGCSVDTVTSGAAGLMKVMKQSYDVVVTDMVMPKMNGLAFISTLKDIQPELPVIVLSSRKDFDLARKALTRGATDYLLKDAEAKQKLIIAVQKASGQAALARSNRELTQKLKQRNEELERVNDQNSRLLDRFLRLNDDLEDKMDQATGELRYRLAEITALDEVAAAINSSIDTNTVLRLILQKSQQVMSAEASTVLLLNDAKDQLVFRVVLGDQGAKLEELSIPAGRGVAGWVAQEGKALVVEDAYADERFDPTIDQQTGFTTTSILCAPLHAHGEIQGVLEVLNPRQKEAFDTRDLRTFQAFVRHAGLAIEHAQLYDRAQGSSQELRLALERERWLTMQRDKLGMYVPSLALEEIVTERERTLTSPTQTINATVMFTDIQGFTSLVEQNPATEIVEALNVYHSAMNAIILQHGGVLDKFIGDGIMIIFVPKGSDDNHALRATRCAIDMQTAVEKLQNDWNRRGLGHLGVRIGLCSGDVVSGSIGAETRRDYTVIGDTVNVASRLESNGRAGQIMLNSSTYELVHDHVEAYKLHPMLVKNRVQPVQPYVIVIGE